MKRFISTTDSYPFLYSAGILFVVLLWTVISMGQGAGNLVFPSPWATLAKLGEMMSGAYIYKCLGISLLRTLEGFAIAFAAALLLGSLAGAIKPLQTFLKPLITVFKSAPTAAFVFLFLVLAGSSQAPIFIVIILAFPILYEAVIGGINHISPEINDAIKVDRGGFFYPLIKIRIPLAAPYVLVGVASSFALSFKTAIMAEIITGSTSYGLGSLINSYRNQDPSDLTPIFAITALAIIIILVIDLLTYVLKRSLGLLEKQ
ncbi:MAG: ABC transporter permease subunit [Bacilli bacterium]|nr:ABC transporter permease subunit [Bacilli bacterium]